MMICRRCQTSNADSSVYCSGCGTPLLRRPKPKTLRFPWLLLVAGALSLLIVLGIFYLLFLKPPNLEKTTDAESSEATESLPTPLETGLGSFLIGEATVFDSSAREVSRWSVAVFGDSWISLPVAALLGGNSVFFQAGSSGDVRLEQGVWSPGDPVALWRVQTGSGLDLPKLETWKPMAPLSWRSLRPDSPDIQVDVLSREKTGSVAGFPLPGEMNIPGVLIQEERLVGWTFGNGLDRGYLWMDSAEWSLKPRISVNQLVVSLSANRRGYFSRAWFSKGTRPALERLETFAQGFLHPETLADEDIPSQLRTENVVPEMHELASALIREGRADEVIRILSLKVLLESSAPLLVQDAVLAMVETKDHYRGIQYLENIKKDYFAARGESFAGLDPFHARLYKDWLRKIIAGGGYFSAMSAFDMARKTFPDDLEIHLLGVEAAMSEENYARAEELLQARAYPSSSKERASQLLSQVKARREESEALTIRFNPGEAHIPVYADLNSRHRLKFIIDTGANTCTIPFSALEPLGIEIDDRTTVKLVSGVGGYGLAYEVTLETVALDGWSIKNIKALIIDLDSYPDCGLLGLNFLNHFRYEIDKEQGIFRLKRF